MASFNLLTDPWINVTDTVYAEQEISLLEVFRQAHEVRAVTDANPLVVASIYRLLLVVLYRALQLSVKPEKWLALYEQGEFPAAVTEYLSSVENRFDLFSENFPFFQTANFQKDAVTSVKKLSPDFATANNKTLFSHHADFDSFSVAPAIAARYLLVAQYFSLGGGISGGSNLAKKHPNYTHAPLIGGVLSYLTGDNLFKTLLLNLRPLQAADTSSSDLPIWERDQLNGVGVREPSGMQDYMTFKCRHIRLLPDAEGNVAEMYISQAYSLPTDSSYRESEPAFAYRLNNKQERKTVPVSFTRSFWRDSRSLYQRAALESEQKQELRPACFRWVADLLEDEDISSEEVSCYAVGLENAKANPLSWLSETLPVNIKLLMAGQGIATGYFSMALDKAEKISVCIFYALQTYAENTLSPNTKKEEVNKVVERIDDRSNYWRVLGLKYPDLIQYISEDGYFTYRCWLNTCLQAARNNLQLTLDNQLGRTTKELKARSLAEHKFNSLLARYRKELKNED